MKKNFWFYGNLHAFLRWLDDEKNWYNKLAETEIDKYIIDIEFEQYKLKQLCIKYGNYKWILVIYW